MRLSINTDYVVLKSSVVEKIHSETLSVNDKKAIMSDLKTLKDAMISIVVFPETQVSVFGKSQHLPTSMTEFLYETGLNLKFINFVDSYFVKPIWSRNFRSANTLFNSKFNITSKLLSTLSIQERNLKINKSMPSSASVYGRKSHLSIRSNHLADGLESVIFACPNCNEFFSLKKNVD